MPTAWRIVRSKHARTAFDGEGARRFGGRWNPTGTRMVYLSATQALAVLEILVHLEDADSLRSGWVLFEVGYEDRHRVDLEARRLPAGWRKSPPDPRVQAVGKRWIEEQESLLLAVPSAILPAETNLLLNPAHPRFRELSIRGPLPLPLDPRLAPGR